MGHPHPGRDRVPLDQDGHRVWVRACSHHRHMATIGGLTEDRPAAWGSGDEVHWTSGASSRQRTFAPSPLPERTHMHTSAHTRIHMHKLSIVECTTHRGKSFIVPLPDVYTVRLTSPLNSWVYSRTAGLGISADTVKEMVRARLQGSVPGLCCQPTAAQRREPRTWNYDTEQVFYAGHREGLRAHGSSQRVLLFKMKIRHSLQGRCCYHPETLEDKSHGQLHPNPCPLSR